MNTNTGVWRHCGGSVGPLVLVVVGQELKTRVYS